MKYGQDLVQIKDHNCILDFLCENFLQFSRTIIKMKIVQ